MHTPFSIISILFLTHFFAYSQEWQKIDPILDTPAAKLIFRTGAISDEQTVWAGGFADGLERLWYSKDGGIHWKEKLAEKNVTFYKMLFYGAHYGWLLGDDDIKRKSFLYFTRNGGINWEKKEFQNDIFALYFHDSLNGICGGYDTVYHTSDGGKTWLANPTTFPIRILDFHFYDRKYGWAGGYRGDMTDTGILLATSDSGKTWYVLKEQTYFLTAVYILNENTGFGIGNNAMSAGKIISTTDGGKVWSTFNPKSSLLDDIIFTDARNGWIVGSYGFILKTTNAGETWEVYKSSVFGNHNVSLNKIDFSKDGKTGFIFGHGGTLLKYNSALQMNKSGYGVKNAVPAKSRIAAKVNIIRGFNHQAFTVYNAAGRRIHSFAAPSPFRHLSNGVYFTVLPECD